MRIALLLFIPVLGCTLEPAHDAAHETGESSASIVVGAGCDGDGICNLGACISDPDCPVLPPATPAPLPGDTVSTRCGGNLFVRAQDSLLGIAAEDVADRYPTLLQALEATSPSWVDAHPAGAFATVHGELEGFGVTMVQGTRSHPAHNASGELDEPTLLFFEKGAAFDYDAWDIIGMGYFFEFDVDDEGPPTDFPAIDESKWWVHEAGYHHSPGDGGFTCATSDDLTDSAFDDGVRIDAAACDAVHDDDLKTHFLDVKHGRFFVVHVWFEPGTQRPTVRKTDPWCRQSSDAVSVPSCAFVKQGTCS